MPNTIPTLSLIIGVFVADAIGPKSDQEQTAHPFLFRLAFAMSILYLVTLAVLLVIPPGSGKPATKLITDAQLYFMGPLQGVVTASLGAFFFKTGG